MPFSLNYKKSSKSLPRLMKAPSRKARLSQHDVQEKKPKTKLRTVRLNLGGVVSLLMEDGNWCTDYGSSDECKELLRARKLHDKLCKENEMLKRRNEILFDKAKAKTEELEGMEKELRQLRRILSKSALRDKN
ncbi:Protein chibby 1 [Orchesella cincta]|uniref:Protein chibby 1 n=1 Tax=Orchesella cincta TaxID=48709 RepID=A0A1D2N4C6_ORCCI|nr:Protein chibby 1 [Orchesella cincta]